MAYPETLSELANYPKALSHAGTGGEGGGNVSVKTLNVTNGSNESVSLSGAIVNGKYGTIEIAANSTVAVQYIEPDAEKTYNLSCASQLTISGTQPEGVIIGGTMSGSNVEIQSTAADGAAVTFTVYDGGGIS